jgi:hypothetical protein
VENGLRILYSVLYKSFLENPVEAYVDEHFMNIERPTSNEKKHSIPNYCCFFSAGFLSGHMAVSSFLSIQNSMLDVGCSTFIGFTHYQQSPVYAQPASISPGILKRTYFKMADPILDQ